MQNSGMYWLIATCTLVLAAIVLVLLPQSDFINVAIIASAMILTMVAPILVIKKLGEKHVIALEESGRELTKTEKELSRVKVKFAEVTTLDDLTGCSNQRHFMDLLIQHRGMAERGTYAFTVAVTQVDQFTEIIEKQGLGRGNEVLQLFSRIIKAALREVDVIARIETDKFGLILSGCSEEDALRIISRINELISQIQVNDKNDMKITASGGITCFHGTESAEELVEHADEALSYAIEQGRDRVAGYNYAEPKA
ncbi:MAG: diguanylate cyclase (GGDEF)-like protein [Candidatus Azotimanducaceae bacterium]|jgi:diguanylate cyclase (GGDEF)-like protein